MIGKITKGSGFGRLFGYLLKAEKNAEILDGSAFSETPDELAREFDMVCSLNLGVSKTVTHVSLAFAQEDGEIDRDTKIRIGEKVIEALGYSNSHYLMVAHGRVDPGHRHEHDHDHMHIALTSVDFDGKWINDFWNFPKLEKALRTIEIEEGLRQVPSSWEAKRASPTSGQRQRYEREIADKGESALPVSNRLQVCINEAAKNSTTVTEFAQRLAHQGIETMTIFTDRGAFKGLNYVMEGVRFQASQLYDASLPKLQSVHGLTFKSKDMTNLREGKEFLLSLPSPSEPVVLEKERNDDDIVGGSLGEPEAALAIVNSIKADKGDQLFLEAEKLAQESEKEASKQIEKVAAKQVKKQTKNSTVAKKKRRHGMSM